MKNKKIFWLAFCTLIVLQTCNATNVMLSMEKDVYYVGDKVPLTLNVIPTGAVGGQLMIYERVNNTYVFVKKVYSKPSPAQCSSCSGFVHDTPLRETLNETFYFIASKPGRYNADANFEGTKDSKNFTILEVTTTTAKTTTTSTTTTTLSCQTWYDQIEEYFAEANYCETNANCKAVELGGMRVKFGCFKYVNKATNETKILDEIDTYDKQCSHAINDCAQTPEAKCVSGKCVTQEGASGVSTTTSSSSTTSSLQASVTTPQLGTTLAANPDNQNQIYLNAAILVSILVVITTIAVIIVSKR